MEGPDSYGRRYEYGRTLTSIVRTRNARPRRDEYAVMNTAVHAYLLVRPLVRGRSPSDLIDRGGGLPRSTRRIIYHRR
eukprot:SAG31_NODE_2230_length_6144_cov_3.629115_4_plen_78_part_00